MINFSNSYKKCISMYNIILYNELKNVLQFHPIFHILNHIRTSLQRGREFGRVSIFWTTNVTHYVVHV